MADRTDRRLLERLRELVHSDVRDALWAERVVGVWRVAALVVGLTLFFAAIALQPWSTTVGIAVALVAAAVPTAVGLARRPLALAVDDHEVLVVESHRWRRSPTRLIDRVAPESLEISFPGLLTDTWQVGERQLGVARTDRSRLEAWRRAPSTFG